MRFDRQARDAVTVDPPSAEGGWQWPSIYALGLLTLVYAFNYLDRQVLSLVLPQIQAEMRVSDTVLGLISGPVFVLFYSLMGVPVARLADRSNRRNIIAAGFAFWSVLTAVTGMVANVLQLAVARFLMGAGEATGIAPSNSIVADLFDRKRRSLAFAILASGSAIAGIILFPMVGWIGQEYGWRASFLAAGLPGILFALLLYLTVREPVRGRFDGGTGTVAPPQESLAATLGYLAGSPAFRLVTAGGALMGVSLYANIVWNATFLARVHDMGVGEIANTLGPIRGFAGIAGGLAAGIAIDRIALREQRWRLWLPGIAAILMLPAELLFLFGGGRAEVFVGLGLVGLFAGMNIGQTYAVCMAIAPPRMRATAAATFLLFANIVGQTVGPLFIGMLNDHLAVRFGPDAIRYSLILAALCAAISGFCFLAAARHLVAAITRVGGIVK